MLYKLVYARLKSLFAIGSHQRQSAKLPRCGREGAVEVRPFPAEKRLLVSEAQGLSGEAVKGNPMTTVIPGVDESKSSPRLTRRLDRTGGRLQDHTIPPWAVRNQPSRARAGWRTE